MTHISYALTPRGNDFVRYVEGIIRRSGARTVCDLGGGANPILSRDFIRQNRLTHYVVDVSEEQLARAPDHYDKAVIDLAAPGARLPVMTDIAFSKHVLEHITQPVPFHLNVRASLNSRGRAVHFFPTLYSTPFVINRLLPERASSRLLPFFISHREQLGSQAKFRALYRWCRGPTSRQIRRFRELGYDVEEYYGFFDSTYLRRWPRLEAIERGSARVLVRHPVPALTSFAQVVLRAAERR